eukprot:1195785-Prorocentrum_minimum.AAC.1
MATRPEMTSALLAQHGCVCSASVYVTYAASSSCGRGWEGGRGRGSEVGCGSATRCVFERLYANTRSTTSRIYPPSGVRCHKHALAFCVVHRISTKSASEACRFPIWVWAHLHAAPGLPLDDIPPHINVRRDPLDGIPSPLKHRPGASAPSCRAGPAP